MRGAIRFAAVGGLLVGVAACAPSYRVTPAPPAPMTGQSVVEGPRDGVVLPAGMRLVAAYGDDAWQVAGFGRSGPVVFGRVAVWDQHWIHVVDQRSGQAVAAVRAPADVWLTAAAVDATGTRVAGLGPDGEAYYWPALAGPPVVLTPVLLEGTSGYRPDRHARDEDEGAIVRAANRIGFSPDGARLLAGMHLWELATGRDLVPLRTDEIVVDATFDDVTVARIGVRHHEGQPGSQCGFVPTWTTLVVESLERRAPDHPPESLAPAIEALPSVPASSPWKDHSFAWIHALDIADDGRVAYVQKDRGWLIDAGGLHALRVDEKRASTTAFDSVTLGEGAIFAVVRERLPGRSPSALYALDAQGGARTRVEGMAASITRDGRAVVGRDGGWEAWTLTGAPRGRDLDFRPKSLHAIDQGRATGGGRVVLRDTAAGASIFEVHDVGKAPRRLRVDGGYNGRWALSDDGSILAAATDPDDKARRSDLFVLDLDDGRVLVREHLDASVWTVAASAHVVAAGDNLGRVRVWRDRRAAEPAFVDIDLRGRYDLAASLAISPDEKLLAIGTGRGRIFVVALD